MKIYVTNSRGDSLVKETDVVEEAERILKSYQERGCWFADDTDVLTIEEIKEKKPKEVRIFWPMAGGVK